MVPPHGIEPRNYWLKIIYSTGLGSSLTVVGNITNFTSIPVFQEALRQLNPIRSSVIVLLGRQVRLASKGVDPSGEG